MYDIIMVLLLAIPLMVAVVAQPCPLGDFFFLCVKQQAAQKTLNYNLFCVCKAACIASIRRIHLVLWYAIALFHPLNKGEFCRRIGRNKHNHRQQIYIKGRFGVIKALNCLDSQIAHSIS